MVSALAQECGFLQINPVTVQAGVQPSGCEHRQAEACAPERLPKYFVNVQQAAISRAKVRTPV
jgi:hypothetical protein